MIMEMLALPKEFLELTPAWLFFRRSDALSRHVAESWRKEGLIKMFRRQVNSIARPFLLSCRLSGGVWDLSALLWLRRSVFVFSFCVFG